MTPHLLTIAGATVHRAPRRAAQLGSGDLPRVRGRVGLDLDGGTDPRRPTVGLGNLVPLAAPVGSAWLGAAFTASWIAEGATGTEKL